MNASSQSRGALRDTIITLYATDNADHAVCGLPVWLYCEDTGNVYNANFVTFEDGSLTFVLRGNKYKELAGDTTRPHSFALLDANNEADASLISNSFTIIYGNRTTLNIDFPDLYSARLTISNSRAGSLSGTIETSVNLTRRVSVNAEVMISDNLITATAVLASNRLNSAFTIGGSVAGTLQACEPWQFVASDYVAPLMNAFSAIVAGTSSMIHVYEIQNSLKYA